MCRHRANAVLPIAIQRAAARKAKRWIGVQVGADVRSSIRPLYPFAQGKLHWHKIRVTVPAISKLKWEEK